MGGDRGEAMMAEAQCTAETEAAAGAERPGRVAAAQIVIGNALPVIGVWFLGWQPLAPMFFYWLDGLLSIWGLGVVAAVVTGRKDPKLLRAKGLKGLALWTAVIGFSFLLLALPSVFAAFAVLATLELPAGGLLRAVFASLGAWVSLSIALVTHAGQTIGELRWRPEETLRATGVARGNFFMHRTLAMAMLVFWGVLGAAAHWALALYVLLVACLFTFAQLNPQAYLRMIGFKEKAPSARRAPKGRRRAERS